MYVNQINFRVARNVRPYIMQRWWYLGDKNVANTNWGSEVVRKVTPPLPDDRKWSFEVAVTIALYPNERVAVTGDCDSLGNFIPNQSLLLKREQDDKWSGTTNLSANSEISYRYFTCTVDTSTNNVQVLRMETHSKMRSIAAIENQSDGQSVDTFGDVAGLIKIDRGWLTSETIIQFKFFNNSLKLDAKLKNRPLFLKITPMNLRIKDEASKIVIEDDSLSFVDYREDSENEELSHACVEQMSLGCADTVLRKQSQFGIPYVENDFILFNVSVAEPENVAFLIDLYTQRSTMPDNSPPHHLAYHYILPNMLCKSDGVLELPISCATKHRPLGIMRVEYLKITALPESPCNLKKSFVRHWNPEDVGLDVGHRGAGTSFKGADSTIRENTIASLKQAAAHGADMVEFDVQLSKDLVPVVYHDFKVYVSLKRKHQLHENDMLELPMRELTLEQMKNLKVYHTTEGRMRKAKFFDEDLEDHQPFPELADVLEKIDSHVGFNIEVKWSQLLNDGTQEINIPFHTTDKNLYLDHILKVVLEKAGDRKIIFSCFDPDICTMLRFKQNMYPVMFLTLGITNKYQGYNDPRCNTTHNAMLFAKSMELLGIVAHSEDLLRDESQVKKTIDNGLILFCWGDDNNNIENITKLKELGLHGVIYDKLDLLTTKQLPKTIFLANEDSVSELNKLKSVKHRKRSAPNHIVASEKILDLQSNRKKLALSNSSSLDSLP